MGGCRREEDRGMMWEEWKDISMLLVLPTHKMELVSPPDQAVPPLALSSLALPPSLPPGSLTAGPLLLQERAHSASTGAFLHDFQETQEEMKKKKCKTNALGFSF